MHFDDIMCHKYQEYCIEIHSEQQRRANEKNYDSLRPFSVSSSSSAVATHEFGHNTIEATTAG